MPAPSKATVALKLDKIDFGEVDDNIGRSKYLNVVFESILVPLLSTKE